MLQTDNREVGTDWKQIGTFSEGKMLLILIYSEYIATKKCKECQLPQLFCSIVASSQEREKPLHGNGELGKVLLLVGLST